MQFKKIYVLAMWITTAFGTEEISNMARQVPHILAHTQPDLPNEDRIKIFIRDMSRLQVTPESRNDFIKLCLSFESNLRFLLKSGETGELLSGQIISALRAGDTNKLAEIFGEAEAREIIEQIPVAAQVGQVPIESEQHAAQQILTFHSNLSVIAEILIEQFCIIYDDKGISISELLEVATSIDAQLRQTGPSEDPVYSELASRYRGIHLVIDSLREVID